MVKLKTLKGAAKRFILRKSKKNLYKCRSAFRNHILTKKSRKQKRNLKNHATISKNDFPKIKNMIY